MLSNFQIDDLAKEHKIKLNYCSFKDTLPKRKYKTFYGIVNLDSSGTDGSHWLALIIRDGLAFYCDSFGQIYPTEIEAFCRYQQVKHLAYNTKEIQYINDFHCGFYALSLLYFVQHNKGNLYDVVEEYLQMFSKIPKNNLAILKAKFNVLI